jgi:hypothetical protein
VTLHRSDLRFVVSAVESMSGTVGGIKCDNSKAKERGVLIRERLGKLEKRF